MIDTAPLATPAVMPIYFQLATMKTSNSDLSAESRLIIDSISGQKTLFPTPIPTIEELNKKLGDFTGSIKTEEERSKLTDKITNDFKAVLISALNQVSIYVLAQANGNRTTAALSGFTLKPERKKATKNKVSGIPVILYSTAGSKVGELVVKIKERKDASVFIVERQVSNTGDEAKDWVFQDCSVQMSFSIGNQPVGLNNYRLWGKATYRSPQPVYFSTNIL